MTREELTRYADPRRYNLILTIGTGRLQGWFVPYGRNDTAPVEGVTVSYSPEPDRRLTLIENAIYDNPLLLEEYDCRILVQTSRQLIFPGDAPQEFCDRAMARFYETDADDVFLAPLGDAQIAFSMCSGLRQFLNRTFAGVEPWHPLVPLNRRFAGESSAPGRIRIYADLDTPMLHLLAFNGSRLLHASTHHVSSTADAAYFIFALWEQSGLDASSGELNVSGSVAMRRELMPLLRRHLNYVSPTLLPAMEGAENIPTPVLLCF